MAVKRSDGSSAEEGSVSKTKEEVLKCYDFDEFDDEDSFQPPPPKKFRPYSPATSTSTPTPPPYSFPSSTTAHLPQSPLASTSYKDTSSSPSRSPARKKIAPAQRKSRQTSPKRAMTVKKPTKTYSRPLYKRPSMDTDSDGAYEGDDDSTRPKPLPLPSVAVTCSTDNLCDPIEDIPGVGDYEFESDDEGGDMPKLGSLVWGRMKGFPYWPCFITKNPDGEFKRDFGFNNKRVEYHAQFFNWNNESGWVSKTMPWCSLEEYKKKANAISKYVKNTSIVRILSNVCTHIARNKNPTEWKAWHPTGKGMGKKWETAYDIAQSTVSMTRKDRHQKFVAHYLRSGARPATVAVAVAPSDPLASPQSELTKKRKRRSRPADQRPSSSIATPPQNGTSNINGARLSKPHPPASASLKTKLKRRNPWKARAGPKSKTLRGAALPLKMRPPQCILAQGDLPPGWTVTNLNRDPVQQEFVSPDGQTFASFEQVVEHLFGENAARPSTGLLRSRSYSFSGQPSESGGSGDDKEREKGWFLELTDAVRYGKRVNSAPTSAGILSSQIQLFKDNSLPRDWLVKTTTHNFRANPASDEVLFIDPAETWFSSKVEAASFLEPKGHPAIDLGQLVVLALERDRLFAAPPVTVNVMADVDSQPVLRDIMSQMSYVEMVKLPDVFLDHPSVRIQEKDNEMITKDAITGEFIAKKIMFEGDEA